MGAAWEREPEGVTGAAQFPQTVWFRGGVLRRPLCPRRAGRFLRTSGRPNRSSGCGKARSRRWRGQRGSLARSTRGFFTVLEQRSPEIPRGSFLS
jgi:hypothetical protein